MVLTLGCTYICVPLGGPIAQWRDESRFMTVRELYALWRGNSNHAGQRNA
jgi:hypothetical protein